MFSVFGWIFSCLEWQKSKPDEPIEDEAMERVYHAKRSYNKPHMILLTPEMIEQARITCMSPKE